MLSFKNRFHGHGSLAYVYRKGKNLRSKLITLKFLTNYYRRFSRVSVVVSKKVKKTAIGRNRIRRRVYEIIYPLINNFEQIFDVVLIINQPEIDNLSYQELKDKITTLFQEAHLIK